LVELDLTWADVAELLRTEPMAAAKMESIMLRRENAALVAKLEECADRTAKDNGVAEHPEGAGAVGA